MNACDSVNHSMWHQAEWPKMVVCDRLDCGEEARYLIYRFWCPKHGDVLHPTYKMLDRPPCPWCGVRNVDIYWEP